MPYLSSMMKPIATLGILLASVFLLSQCSTGKIATTSNTTSTDEALLTVAQKTWNDCTLQQLQSGKDIYATKCTGCHAMKSITQRSETEWKGAIASMAPKAKLTPEETLNLTRYLLAARQLK